MRKANSLDEAKKLFDENNDPVECSKEGADPKEVTSVSEAEEYYAD